MHIDTYLRPNHLWRGLWYLVFLFALSNDQSPQHGGSCKLIKLHFTLSRYKYLPPSNSLTFVKLRNVFASKVNVSNFDWRAVGIIDEDLKYWSALYKALFKATCSDVRIRIRNILLWWAENMEIRFGVSGRSLNDWTGRRLGKKRLTYGPHGWSAVVGSLWSLTGLTGHGIRFWRN